jgi:CRP-like cAMP-binding protein
VELIAAGINLPANKFDCIPPELDMRIPDELKIALQKITGTTGENLSALDKLCSIKYYKKKAFFLKSGDIAHHSGFVMEGAFREYYADNNGREYNKAFSFKGDFTGSYYDLHRQKPSLVTIEALADSSVVVIDHKKYQNLVESDPFWLKVSYQLAHNLLMKKFEKEEQLLTLSAAERYELLQKQYPELEQLVPAYHIASYLGITPISLSRIRAQKVK